VWDLDAPEPELRGGEALVRPTVMGVCSMDVGVAGGLVPFSGVMGHEFVGVVERIADGGYKELVGARVVGSMSVACGACDMCRKGLSAHCRVRTVLGLSGRDGCFADRVCVPVRNLHVVPAGVSDEEGVFAELVGAALHTRHIFKVEGRPFVTVLGDGKLGLLVVQVMAKLNASVRLLGKHAGRLALCDRWGIKHRMVEEVGLRHDQDVVIDCTGTAQGLELAMQMVRPRGKIILKGPAWGTRAAGVQMGVGFGAVRAGVREGVDLSPLVAHEIELIGSRCGSVPEALGAIATKQIDVLPLISKRGKLAEGVEMLRLAGAGELKVVMAA